jgi:hypothetical protein
MFHSRKSRATWVIPDARTNESIRSVLCVQYVVHLRYICDYIGLCVYALKIQITSTTTTRFFVKSSVYIK